MATVLCVLYDDPVSGYPPSYAREGIPKIERYHDGQSTPSPEAIDFTPGELLGSVSGELGLRRFIEERGHQLTVTADKDGPDSVFERELPEAEIVISQPFWPAYLTAERIAKAPNLKLAVTAGIGSDHVDLQAAIDNEMTVAEVTLLQLDQRRRARRHADPGPRPRLPRPPTRSFAKGAGTSQTPSRARTTSRGCRSAPSGPAASARRCSAA